MSKEKRKKSKASKVLKAVGTAGVVLGAASLDANVVFAAELEEELNNELDGEAISEEVLEGGSQSGAESVIASESTAPAESEEQTNPGTSAADETNNVEDQTSEQPDAGTQMSDSTDTEQSETDEQTPGSETDNNGQDDNTEELPEADDITNEAEGDETGSTEGGEGEENSASESWSEVLSTSDSNLSDAVSESDSTSESASVSESAYVSDSESTSESASASESLSTSDSESTSESVSVSESFSASESESMSMSESESAVESWKESLTMFVNRQAATLAAGMDTSNATYAEKAELDRLLQEYKNNLTALEEAKHAESPDVAQVAACEKAVAESIVKYEVASKGAAGAKTVWDEKSGSYIVTYTDASSGKEVTEFYQYNRGEDGNVHVYVANASYNGADGATYNYEIVVKEDGKQCIIVNDKEFEVLETEDNGGGSISYVIAKEKNEAGFVIAKIGRAHV